MEEKIIEILESNEKPAQSAIEINDKLKFTTIDEYKKLENTLEKMTREGILYYSEKKKRYLLLKNSHLIKGKLLLNPKGFGFVEIDKGSKDIYINSTNLNNARNNDTVLIELINNKTEGRIIRIIDRDYQTFVGCVYFKDGICYVKPDKKGSPDIEIASEYTKGIVEGHKVVVKPIEGSRYLGAITHVIGHINDVGIDVLSYVYQYNFHPEFPDEVKEQLLTIPDKIDIKQATDRLDLRDQTIFTIDGDDTKDIDDAISIKKLNNNEYELGVHIADVSYYVKESTPLDEEAYLRGTSLYLVDRVIPMLPHQLSNGICSLNPNTDRFALSCIMTIDKNGKVTSYNITPSIIRSRIKMTYNKVNDILENNIIDPSYAPYVEDLKLMLELSNILRNKMIRNGYIEFSSNEAKIIVDENCHPIDIKLRTQRTGEKLIENFMIIANETVASYIYYQELPGIYRVHDKPDEKRLTSFFDFLSSRGYVVAGKRNNITSKDLQKILAQLKDKPDSKVLNDIAIRSQAKAVYSNINIGHFGLGSKCYSHFTSPIRRYPDLILHRLIKSYQKYDKNTITKWEQYLPTASEHCSLKEQEAQKCERDVDDMKKAEYMEDHIGDVYKAVISGVQEFGIFVELDNTIEGLIKSDTLPNGPYKYQEKAMSLVSANNRNRYTFGDEIVVKCISANHETSMIDFELVPPKNKETNNNLDKNNKYHHKKKKN